MIRVEKKKKKAPLWRQVLVSAAVFAAVIAAFAFGTKRIRADADRKGAESLKESIQRATVECYAIEGRYPPSVAYLEENYGIRIDRNRFSVFYEGFASNIIPDITVVENGKGIVNESNAPE